MKKIEILCQKAVFAKFQFNKVIVILSRSWNGDLERGSEVNGKIVVTPINDAPITRKKSTFGNVTLPMVPADSGANSGNYFYSV